MNFKQWFNVFLIIFEAWQGYDSKAYGVSNHHLKLQSKNVSRSRDIRNFPTQGWADTAFCTSNWSETYRERLMQISIGFCTYFIGICIALGLGVWELWINYNDVFKLTETESDTEAKKYMACMKLFTALFTKPPDSLPPYRMRSGCRSVLRFPTDIFPFCRERPVSKEPAALWITL